jgi:NitT/TauT family transport system ATP-binding protein
LVDRQDVLKMNDAELRELRRHKVSMVFQNFGLFPHRRVIDNVAYGLEVRGVPKVARMEQATRMIDLVGLAGWEQHLPRQLSGGMQQRVGLARALAVEPKVLLMDEPFAALDAMTREALRRDLLQLWTRRRMAVVFVTHDIDEAIFLSQRIVVLKPRPGRVDEIVDVRLPARRWEQDPRALPEFIALREHLWDRIRNMVREGGQLEELGRAFPDTDPVINAG